MKTKTTKTVGVVTLALAAVGTQNIAEAAPKVRLNGQPLATSTAPVVRNGRTLVPMRDIFEALGANVNYNNLTRGITATRGATRVGLEIGNPQAMVNGRRIALETAPSIVRGSTMVPLRFVSEAMGAQVRWNQRRQLVSINTGGAIARRPGQAVAGYRTINVPVGAVVPITLDSELSSATARVGDTFMTSSRSQAAGDSEFPAGSKVEGFISEVQARTGDNPGMLDLDFRNVVLPDGTRVPIRGSLIALDNESVSSTTQGRVMAKTQERSNADRLKVIGIGAGAGFLLGKVLLKKDGLLSGVLGAAGGYLYDMQKNKKAVREAVLPAGTALGVRLNSNVAYTDTTNYAAQRASFLGR